MNGICKWFSTEKGYGFVTDEKDQDYFVHYSQIQAEGYRSLVEGESVTFDVGPGKSGKEQAINVRVSPKAELGTASTD